MTTKQNPAPLAGGNGATSEEQLAPSSTTSRKCEGRLSPLEKPARPVQRRHAVYLDTINKAPRAAFLAGLLARGERVGAAIVAINLWRAGPLRSFKVNRDNKRWANFATGDNRGYPNSPVGYLPNLSQAVATRLRARMQGLEAGGRRDG